MADSLRRSQNQSLWRLFTIVKFFDRRWSFASFALAVFQALSATSFATDSDSLRPLQIKRIQEMTSYFEDSSVTFSYGYAENLHDGRGLTVGRVGFCTGTDDAIRVVRLYCGHNRVQTVCRYLPRLTKILTAFSKTHQPIASVKGLSGFSSAWKEAARDSRFRKAQDDVVMTLYWKPAMARATEYGVQTAIGKAILYDTLIQHGDGVNAGDGLLSFLQLAGARESSSIADERRWLNRVLDARRADLLNPHDQNSRAEWAASVDRVDTLRAILGAGDEGLTHPVHLANGVWTE